MKKTVSITLFLMATLSLVACGKHEEKKAELKCVVRGGMPICNASDGNSDSTSLSDAQSPEKIKAALQEKKDQASKGDSNMPLDKFQKMMSGNQIMFAWLAVDGTPLDDDAVLSALSSDYRRESDQFKKRDLSKRLVERIQQEVTSAKENKYWYFDIDDSDLIGAYDFDKKSFPVTVLRDSSSYRYFNDNYNFHLTFPNSESFSSLPVADEAKARLIENLRTQYRKLYIRIYFHAGTSEVGTKNLRGNILRIQLRDKDDAVLSELSTK